MPKIPVVDLRWTSSEESDEETISKEIEEALSQVGFVYLVNHGIPQEKIDKAFSVSKEFFELPPEVKRKYGKIPGGFHGYVEPGQELLNVTSKYEIREAFDIPVKRVDSYPNAEIPDFKKSLLDLQFSCHPLINFLNRILAKALHLKDEDFFISNHKWLTRDEEPSLSSLRSSYYPRIEENSQVEAGTVRLAEHTDYGTITLLFQDAIGGLEVKSTENKWLPATPIPGSILVNTGDLLEFWSGGHFPATPHRVLIPEEELRKRVPRQSIVHFVHPDSKAIVIPLKDTPNNDPKYQQVTAGEYILQKFNAAYNY